jgi:hypothetical protein
MQPQPHSKLPGRPTAAAARRPDEPLGDGALVALLGGIYLGGLGAFVAVALAINQVL